MHQPPPPPQHLSAQQQQQHHHHPGQIHPSPAVQAAMASKEMATITFWCRFGQETVQDIVQKATELFNVLKGLSLPNGSLQANQQEERKAKCQESLRTISQHFKRLSRIYDRVNEQCATIESKPIDQLIPFDDDSNDQVMGGDDFKSTTTVMMIKAPLSEAGQNLKAQYDEQMTILRSKNRAIKQTMDALRELVWDINTMLAMRK